jgi:hypothetical protein
MSRERMFYDPIFVSLRIESCLKNLVPKNNKGNIDPDYIRDALYEKIRRDTGIDPIVYIGRHWNIDSLELGKDSGDE